jgi:hypothetical protein
MQLSSFVLDFKILPELQFRPNIWGFQQLRSNSACCLQKMCNNNKLEFYSYSVVWPPHCQAWIRLNKNLKIVSFAVA